MRIIFLIFFFLLSFSIKAQQIAWEREFSVIDSLLEDDHLANAQRKVSFLYQQLNRTVQSGQNRINILELKYRQAILFDRQYDLSSDALSLLLDIIDEAEAENQHVLSSRIYLLIALCYEKVNYLELTKKYLELADYKIKEHNLILLHSTYYVRKSSYHRFANEVDSMIFYAEKANMYAQKYNNKRDLLDSHLLLGLGMNEIKKYDNALKHKFFILNQYRKSNNAFNISYSYNNIATTYLRKKDFIKALSYNDSAYMYYEDLPLINSYHFSGTRSQIFEELGKIDSAFYYLEKYHEGYLLSKAGEEKLGTKQLEEQYQSKKKELVIEQKERQMIFTVCLLVIIIIASVLLFFQNKKINKQNTIIGAQLKELKRNLEQKQMLLSELQHRVKNNLQHVLSILEIQKDSIDVNNIEESIRANQNRIHSMALLHKKLNVSDGTTEVDMKRYITELSALVIDSYDNCDIKIAIEIRCNVETMSIEMALPIGLIITELVSNSMKHAFENMNAGVIRIEMIALSDFYQLHYADNGKGFDFNVSNKTGLGLSIIKGLIDQIDGTVTSRDENGFDLWVSFFKEV